MKTVPCETCGESTDYTGTKRCQACWEVESRLGGYLVRGAKNARKFILEALLDNAKDEEAA